MIGPIPMDDPFADPFPGGPGNTNAALMWQERQRRARTVRMMMMFLMMLLLMDGEEPNGGRHRHRHGGRHGRDDGGYLRNGRRGAHGRDGLVELDENVYVARLFQDDKIRNSLKADVRRSAIVKLNEGRDVEGDVREWVEGDMKAEADAAAAAAAAAEDDEAEEDSGKTKKGKERTKAGGGAAAAGAGKDADESNRKAHHYPRNATGYYRGEWKVAPQKKKGNNDDDAENNDDPDKSNSASAEEGDDGKKTVEANDDGDDVEGKVVDEYEIEATMKGLLREKGERVGVYLLPPDLLLPTDDGANSTSSKAGATKDKGTKDAAPTAAATARHMRPPKVDDKKDKGNDPPKLSLSQSSGRAAFQLYARPIPAMTELSLIDGFVKLYDGTNTAFSTRRDILLRVRGVVVHAIGRISLVANADSTRSAMVIRTEEDGGDAENDDATTDEDGGGGDDGDVERQQRIRRRLLGEAVSALIDDEADAEAFVTNSTLSKAWRQAEHPGAAADAGGRDEGLLEKIRDDALSLFANVADAAWDVSRHGFIVDAFGNDIDGDADDGDGFADLFFGESSRQWTEFLSSRLVDDAAPAVAAAVEDMPGGDKESSASSWLSSLVEMRRSLRVVEVEEEQEKQQEQEEDREESDVEEDAEESGAEEEEDGSDETLKASLNATSKLDAGGSATSQRRTKAIRSDAKETARKKKETDAALERMTKDVQPFPYAPDDAEHTLRKASTPASRRIPYREQSLEQNAAQCEFQLSFDVKETEWTLGQWRKMVGRQAREVRDLDPALRKDEDDANEDDEEGNPQSSAAKKKKKRSSSTVATRTKSSPSSGSSRKLEKDEALVMALTGTIVSPNCDFSSTINVTAIRTDWEHTTGKAINYSFYMMLTCLTQIVVLLRQLLHTQAQSAATRVSLVCVGWQTVLDAILCIGHIFLCLVMQPLFTAFASVAFFKLLIFCVIEMKYMAIIIQARNNANNANTSAEDLRRQVALLHLRFYSFLVLAIMLFWYMGQKHRTAYVLMLYSFWVPQIIQNIITEAKKPLHHYYIYGMSVTRLVAPLYVFAVPNNFLKEVNPEFPTNFVMCQLLILWVGVQTAILIGQSKYGTRFMIPARFLPPKFDYSRPIPSSLLPPPPTATGTAGSTSEGDSSSGGRGGGGGRRRSGLSTPPDMETIPLTSDEAVPSPSDSTTGVTRNRMKGNRSRVSSRDNGTTVQVEEPTNNCGNRHHPTLDCVICYNGIDITNRRGYMLAPCDHIFHRDCLVQWMDVKMECPICRTELPAL